MKADRQVKRPGNSSRRSFKDIEKVKVIRRYVVTWAGESKTALISASKAPNMASDAA